MVVSSGLSCRNDLHADLPGALGELAQHSLAVALIIVFMLGAVIFNRARRFESASLDSGASIASVDARAEAAWDKLADEREQELAVGTAATVPLDVATARLEARFPG
jgi:hypothetical protein